MSKLIIDWSKSHERSLTADLLTDAAEDDHGLPFALMLLALERVDDVARRQVLNALSDVATEYGQYGYESVQ